MSSSARNSRWALGLFALLLFTCLGVYGQSTSSQPTALERTRSTRSWQRSERAAFKNPQTSPLDSGHIKGFRLPFFPINPSLAQTVRWERCADSNWFEMSTSTERKPLYRKYAYLYFQYEGQTLRLTAFQSQALQERDGFEDYLFVPFGDETNGHETYGGGRYVEVERGDWVLDFNQAYNPYCAYSGRWSCPKVPQENLLDVRIEAGTRYKPMAGHL